MKSLRQNLTSLGNHTRPHFSKHPIHFLQWFQDSIHVWILHQAASESVIFMLLAVEIVEVEEVDVLIAKVAAEDVDDDVDKVEE